MEDPHEPRKGSKRTETSIHRPKYTHTVQRGQERFREHRMEWYDYTILQWQVTGVTCLTGSSELGLSALQDHRLHSHYRNVLSAGTTDFAKWCECKKSDNSIWSHFETESPSVYLYRCRMNNRIYLRDKSMMDGWMDRYEKRAIEQTKYNNEQQNKLAIE